MATRLAVVRTRNPMAVLERMPGWWKGRADMRLHFAQEALAQGLEDLASEHFRIATEYERKIKSYVELD